MGNVGLRTLAAAALDHAASVIRKVLSVKMTASPSHEQPQRPSRASVTHLTRPLRSLGARALLLSRHGHER